jgi:hypothetical protein
VAAIDGETVNIYDVSEENTSPVVVLTSKRYKHLDSFLPMQFLRQPRSPVHQALSAEEIQRVQLPHDTLSAQFRAPSAKSNVSRRRLRIQRRF